MADAAQDWDAGGDRLAARPLPAAETIRTARPPCAAMASRVRTLEGEPWAARLRTEVRSAVSPRRLRGEVCRGFERCGGQAGARAGAAAAGGGSRGPGPLRRRRWRGLEGGVLPVVAPLARLLPAGGLRRGTTVAVAAGPAATSLLWAVLVEASAGGAWVGVVGRPDLGLVAAAEAGMRLERLALVPAPGPELHGRHVRVARRPRRRRHGRRAPGARGRAAAARGAGPAAGRGALRPGPVARRRCAAELHRCPVERGGVGAPRRERAAGAAAGQGPGAGAGDGPGGSGGAAADARAAAVGPRGPPPRPRPRPPSGWPDEPPPRA